MLDKFNEVYAKIIAEQTNDTYDDENGTRTVTLNNIQWYAGSREFDLREAFQNNPDFESGKGDFRILSKEECDEIGLPTSGTFEVPNKPYYNGNGLVHYLERELKKKYGHLGHELAYLNIPRDNGVWKANLKKPGNYDDNGNIKKKTIHLTGLQWYAKPESERQKYPEDYKKLTEEEAADFGLPSEEDVEILDSPSWVGNALIHRLEKYFKDKYGDKGFDLAHWDFPKELRHFKKN